MAHQWEGSTYLSYQYENAFQQVVWKFLFYGLMDDTKVLVALDSLLEEQAKSTE